MRFRKMEFTDIPAGVQLCRSAGWNQLPRDWEFFLTRDPEGSVVCEDDQGAVIGTVTTIRYDGRFAWIGMVLVDPLHRRKGIGRRLLEEAGLLLTNERCVKLDATPAGREVYTKLGYKDEYNLNRMVAHKIDHRQLNSRHAVIPFTTNDLARIKAFDKKVFGADRVPLLSWLLAGSPTLAFKVEEGNNVSGYCFGRQGVEYTHIGPVVADSLMVAQSLVSAALKLCKNKSVIMDVPDHDEVWRRWLASVGFTLLRPFVRMYAGDNRYPGIPANQYAILGPEFG